VTIFKGGRLSRTGKRSGLGRSFGRLVDYLLHGKGNPDRAAWTATLNLDTEDPGSAALIMAADAQENPRVQLPVYHFGLSLAEGEHLSQRQWTAAAERVLERMGLGGHQAVLVSHHDTDKEHAHIVVNRVGEDGRVWNPRRDMSKAHPELRRIEIEYGLHRLGGQDLKDPQPSQGAYQEARRTGQAPLADRVRLEAGPLLARAASWGELEEGLAELGYRIEPAARSVGLVVTDGQRRAALSHVERGLSGPALARRFGETFRAHRERHPDPPAIRTSGPRGEPLPGSTLGERAAALVERVSATRATFTADDLQRAAFFQPESVSLVREALGGDQLLDLGRDSRGATRYTSREYLAAESRLFASAALLADRQELRLDPAAVEPALARAPRLSGEQRAAVLHATTGADLAQIVGRAGAGKTTVARAIAETYRAAGYSVQGAALAGKAAEGLAQTAGLPSRTLASLEYAWSRGRDALDARSVLVIDEAGMIDARQLGRVLDQAQRAQAKVILLGDPDQLPAIGAGDAYRGLLEVHPSATLDTIRRQAEPWQREASAHLAAGRVATALDAYDGAGGLEWTDSRAAARDALVARYLADRAAAPDPARLIVTYRNADARLLNDAIRDHRRQAGDLPAGVTVGGADYAAGDRIVFLRNDNAGLAVANLEPARAVGVKNGTLGTVEAAAENRLAVRLDDGRRVAFDPGQYDALAHGYAVTIHKSQGVTVDRAYLLPDTMMNRNAAYVALTRHRHEMRIFADRETFGSREALDRTLSRASVKDLARDYGAAQVERAAQRLASWQRQAEALRREVQTLRAGLVTLERAEAAHREVAGRRDALAAAAGRVYADPRRAMSALLADPAAAGRLAAGDAAAYGPLAGRSRPVLGASRARAAALAAVPTLATAVSRHAEAGGRAERRLAAAASLGATRPVLEARLAHATASLAQIETATRAPAQALANVLLDLGEKAGQAVLSLLPKTLILSARLTLRAFGYLLDPPERDRGR
jgi:Ti-type conjugative transfer relaxase TraA